MSGRHRKPTASALNRRRKIAFHWRGHRKRKTRACRAAGAATTGEWDQVANANQAINWAINHRWTAFKNFFFQGGRSYRGHLDFTWRRPVRAVRAHGHQGRADRCRRAGSATQGRGAWRCAAGAVRSLARNVKSRTKAIGAPARQRRAAARAARSIRSLPRRLRRPRLRPSRPAADAPAPDRPPAAYAGCTAADASEVENSHRSSTQRSTHHSPFGRPPTIPRPPTLRGDDAIVPLAETGRRTASAISGVWERQRPDAARTVTAAAASARPTGSPAPPEPGAVRHPAPDPMAPLQRVPSGPALDTANQRLTITAAAMPVDAGRPCRTDKPGHMPPGSTMDPGANTRRRKS